MDMGGLKIRVKSLFHCYSHTNTQYCKEIIFIFVLGDTFSGLGSKFFCEESKSIGFTFL